MILEEETFERFGYHSCDLRPRSNKRILAACDDCGKVRVIKKVDYRAFCRPCSKKGENKPSREVVRRICEVCGKEFEVLLSRIRYGKGRFCSRSCADEGKKGKNHPRWKGGRVKRICENCGKEFEEKPSIVKRGGGRFCSLSCSRRKRRIPKHHTKPELVFGSISKNNDVPSLYTGDGQLWIGKKGGEQHNPDFIIKMNGKRYVVEIDGDYWHSPLLNNGLSERRTVTYREKFYKKHRWIPIFIWETDLLREDAEDFVVSQLEKYGVLQRKAKNREKGEISPSIV